MLDCQRIGLEHKNASKKQNHRFIYRIMKVLVFDKYCLFIKAVILVHEMTDQSSLHEKIVKLGSTYCIQLVEFRLFFVRVS